MTKEERLELLKQIEKDIYVPSMESTFLDDAKSCAIHSVIKALEQEPCEDCISRQAVLNHIYGINGLEGFENSNVFEKHYADFIKALPPVSTQQKTGHWIEQDNGNMLSYHRYKCSVCGGNRTGETGDWIQIHDCKWKYCPDCGSKMESEVNE